MLQPRSPREPEFLEQLADLAVDCAPVVAYGALVPQAALDLPRHGWVNLHFSLLPAWRGAAPVQHAIMAGDEITGASTFRLEAGLDTGPVFGTVTEADRPAGHRRRPARPARGQRRRPAGRHPRRHRRRQRWSPSRSRPRASAWRRGSRPPTRGSTGRCPRTSSTGGSAASRRRRAPGRRGAATGCGSARSSRCPTVDLARRRASSRSVRDGVLVGTGRGAVRLGEVQPAGKRMLPAADWARGARPQPGERVGG